MGKISADTLRKVYLLYALALFKNGSYGSVRLQKVAYIAERGTPVHPFKYIKWVYGEFSRELEDTKEQLESMGYIAAVPLDAAAVMEWGDEGGGNRLYVRDKSKLSEYRSILASYSAELPAAAFRAVTTYGYKREQELLDICYSFPEFKETEEGETIFEANLPELVEVDLDEGECEDLEIAMNPRFTTAVSQLAAAVEATDIDWDSVRKVERLSFPRP